MAAKTDFWPWLIGGTVGFSALWWLVAQPASAQDAIADTCVLTESLREHLAAGGNFGTKAAPSPEVAEAQRALQVADDGIVGPATRAVAAQHCGITLPPRRGKRGTITDAQGSGHVAYVGMTGPNAQTVPIAVESVIEIPPGHKGSLAAQVKLNIGWLEKKGAMLKYGSISGIEAQARHFLLANRAKLNACPGAPTLVRAPSVVIRDISTGFDMQVRWAAQWPSASKRVPASLRACMSELLRKDPAAGPYITSSMISRS